jgi:hypothetical protein
LPAVFSAMAGAANASATAAREANTLFFMVLSDRWGKKQQI